MGVYSRFFDCFVRRGTRENKAALSGTQAYPRGIYIPDRLSDTDLFECHAVESRCPVPPSELICPFHAPVNLFEQSVRFQPDTSPKRSSMHRSQISRGEDNALIDEHFTADRTLLRRRASRCHDNEQQP